MHRIDGEPIARGFPQTRHSALAAIRSGNEEQRRRGLEALASIYWRPVYGYLRLHWRRPHEEARDLTQDFFAYVLEHDVLARFDPRRARLRTFMRVCIDGLVSNVERAARRMKRGGGECTLPLDFESVRREVDSSPTTADSPDVLFEREWARGLFDLALAQLRARCEREGKQRHFALLEQYDLAPDRPSYAEAARRMGVATTDVTNWLAWARRELRGTVLEILRESTATDSEFRDEARALLGVDPR